MKPPAVPRSGGFLCPGPPLPPSWSLGSREEAGEAGATGRGGAQITWEQVQHQDHQDR